MTFRTVREQAKERLQERALRQAKIGHSAMEVVAHVLETELVNAPDAHVTAGFAGTERGLDMFGVQVSVAVDAGVEGVYYYRVHPAIGPNPLRITLVVKQIDYDNAPTQVWRSTRTNRRFNDIIDAIIDATEWTLEDLT